ncbi:Branched-chain-amino-acid aminotransferase [Rhodobacteraceae bacterium THAF1]|uniref:branched-chain amino acid aminotransferase n=1 Tax=Palleronia sp. THAF1 TaxID=2587842 RepID=UPI000F3DB7CB|nr:branched-chain amino acid aminotransferase [Palleronia sp. THAF1]QFU07885.1 Branched-chain-amino-acid aminotransferase [Palleronia sp. THAF1]VDC25719.1 Branched-chain-amino-acid aminotransferase [Rhodobacteraceae bacterium THAF1]
MAIGTHIRTYHNGTWHEGDPPLIRAADHGAWLGSNVFDGARYAHGVAPDLDLHCARLNQSATALGLSPTVDSDAMVKLIHEGLALYPDDAAIYIRPMYWAVDGGPGAIGPGSTTAFAVSLECIALAPDDATTTLTTTRFHRPTLETNVTNAKAGCLYPNNARMLREAQDKGFGNALVADPVGNVAETATANVFIVKDGVVRTPIPNGTFLAGITRARHIDLLRRDGHDVREDVITFDQVRAADEVFITGNMSKITPVTAFDDVTYRPGPVASRARKLYWDWARAT